MIKDCCTGGFNTCFCNQGQDAFGELCSNCKGLCLVFCQECDKGAVLKKISHRLFDTDEREWLKINSQSVALNLMSFKFLAKLWNDVIDQNFLFIEKVCTSQLMDPHFLRNCLLSDWVFGSSATKDVDPLKFQASQENWPRIYFNDPKPFAPQLQLWVERFILGLNPILPQHYDLKQVFSQISYLAQSCPYWNAKGSGDLGKHFEYSLRVRLLSHRVRELGMLEEVLSMPELPLQNSELSLFE